MKVPALGLVGWVCLAVGLMAADGKAAGSLDPLPPDVSPQTTTIDGEVLGVDTLCKTVKVQSADGSVDLLVKENTEIFLDGLKITDLKAVHAGLVSKTFFRNNGDAARIVLTSQ